MTPFVGPSYELALPKADLQRSVNMTLAGLETPGKAPFVLRGIDGYTLHATGAAAARGCLATNDRCFFVMGPGLYELSHGELTHRGSLSSSTGPVSMAYGTTQLVIVDGANGYVLTLATNDFEQITADGFYGSATVVFFDNYFLFVRPDTGQFYLSAINDALTFDATDFATAESQPDNLVAIVVCQRRALLMGALTIEPWSDSGGADFPMEREGTTIEVGCLAPHSVIVLDNTAFWIGRDRNGSGIVYRLNGYQAQRISQEGIERALQSADLSRATAWAFQKNGSTYYAINAPGLTSTFVYELRTGAWQSLNDEDSSGEYSADRRTCHVYFDRRHLFGCSDGTIVELAEGVYEKAGRPLVRERVSPHTSGPGLRTIFFDAFHLDCATGDAPQDVDPFVELSYSDDSGASWSTPSLKSTGKVGERFQRITWRNLGRSRDRVWKVKATSNARFDILNVQIDTRPGAN